MVSASLRAATMATTHGQLESFWNTVLPSSSLARTCQNAARTNVRTIQIAREIPARITGREGTPYCVANWFDELGQVFGLNRQAANPFARQGVHRVANRRRHDRQTRFADPRRLFGALYHVDFRLRRLRDA